MLNDTLSFLTVDKYYPQSDLWITMLTDNDWETEFEWFSTNFFLGQSEVEIRWFVPKDQEPGTYRISHAGAYKTFFKKIFFNGDIRRYSGRTQSFEIK